MGRLMAELGIWATTPRRLVRTTRREEEVPLPDLVGWDFAPAEPGRRSVSDITYIRTGEGLATSPRWPMLALAGSWASHCGTGCPMTWSSRPSRRRLGTRGSLAGAIGLTDRAI
jgi:putative transposase